MGRSLIDENGYTEAERMAQARTALSLFYQIRSQVHDVLDSGRKDYIPEHLHYAIHGKHLPQTINN